jgi:class 3 adenylate cyclase
LVTEAGGYMDKIMGDGFMALFNAPILHVDHASRAVRTAIAMRRLVVDANRTRAHKLSVRIGVHSGEAVVGNIGTSILMNYTAIGATVNTAKRVEESCEPDQILISGDTYALLDRAQFENESTHLVAKGARHMKGLSNSLHVFAVEDHTISEAV